MAAGKFLAKTAANVLTLGMYSLFIEPVAKGTTRVQRDLREMHHRHQAEDAMTQLYELCPYCGAVKPRRFGVCHACGRG